MQVDPTGYRQLSRGLQIRIVLFFVGSGLALLFALFWLLVGGVGCLIPENPDDRPIGALVIIIGGLCPAILAGLVIVKAVLDSRKLARLERLAVLIRRDAEATVESLAQDMYVSQAICEQLVFEAASKGAFTDVGIRASRDESRPAAQPPSCGAGQSHRAPVQAGVVFGATPDALLQVGGQQMRESPSWDSEATPSSSDREPSGWETNPLSWDTSPSGWGSRSLTETLSGRLLNGTYQIEDQLGAGGMGAVYVARHVRTGRRYAVKALHPDARFSDDAIRRFKREAAAASALGHRGIVAIHDFDVTAEGIHFLVSELLLGETLEARLEREKAFTWGTAARIICEVGGALEVAHDAGILHRDLKPGNMFIDRSGGGGERIVLLDFGLAKSINDPGATKITTTGMVVGTPLYMSPEQACSDHVDARSDVYALGAVFYELLTGSPPFMAETVAGVYSRLLNETPRPPGTTAPHPLPQDTDELFERVLCRDPEGRFQTVQAFLGAIREIRRKNPSLDVD